MDVPEKDGDIMLQSACASFLADFCDSLPTFLWVRTSSGRCLLRRTVSARETNKHTALVSRRQIITTEIWLTLIR